jgi:hypothetical protein
MARVIRVGRGKFGGNNQAALQRAVDAVAADGGGVVEIPAGVYEMEDALHLRRNVRVIGDGQAVLRKVPSVSSPIADYLGYGHSEFTVAEPRKFKIGMGVHLTDRRAGGFYDTVATIVGRNGRLFFINEMLHHDYSPRAGGCVSTLFPLVCGYGVSDVAVEGLVLDGNRRETRRLNGCRGAGVFLLNCRRVRIERVEVRHYFGDAVSFQQCAEVIVRDCFLHDNRGNGLHPGSGSVRYVFEGNRVVRNDGCGLFYCLRTKYSLCEHNHFEANRREGISIGERDTHHLIRDNVIRNHGGAGIAFREPLRESGDDVLVTGNRCEHNCRKTGRHEIVIPGKLHRVWILRNSIASAKGRALSVGPKCSEIRFAENVVNGRPQSPRDVDGKRTLVRLAAASGKLAVGPAAAPGDAARHLPFGVPPARKR